MRIVTIKIKGIAPYQQGRYHQEEKKNKETSDDYEKRTWKNRAHLNTEGKVIVPPMAIKKAIEAAARYLSLSIPGEGKAKYTKHFRSGILVVEPMVLNKTEDEIKGLWVFGDSRGGGGSTRVLKCFPTVYDWEGDAQVYILDDKITKDVFERVVKEAGNLIGIGVFRPENGGYYGRFVPENFQWEEVS